MHAAYMRRRPLAVRGTPEGEWRALLWLCASRRNFFIKTDFDTRRRLSYLSITRENAYPRNLQTYADIIASHDFDKNCLTTRQADLSDHIDFNTASLATVRLFIQSESEYHE